MPSPSLPLFRSLAGVGAALAAFFLAGCATDSNSANMAATPLAPVAKHAASVSVTVTGGSATSSLDTSTIGNADFAEAIKASITKSGLFARLAADGPSADYQLEAVIVRVDQPEIGLAMTATVEVKWTLTRTSNQWVAWQKSIVSSHTTKAGEAFEGPDRLRLANEGAARGNIQDALAQIGAAELP